MPICQFFCELVVLSADLTRWTNTRYGTDSCAIFMLADSSVGYYLNNRYYLNTT